MIDTRKPMFKVAANVFEAMSLQDINKTAQDMQEMGIYQSPFPKLFLNLKASVVDKFFEVKNGKTSNIYSPPKSEVIFDYEFENGMYRISAYISRDGFNFRKITAWELEEDKNGKDYMAWIASNSLMILIVLLATKNIQKDVETCNKPNSRNRREQRLSKYSSTTTISIGKIKKTMRSENGTGGPVRPHLRRGHIRHQRCGEGKLEVKKIFIQPMFINADQGWIDTQKEYRVKA